jgi:hypothetical protein
MEESMLAPPAEIKSRRCFDTKCYIRFIRQKTAPSSVILDEAAGRPVFRLRSNSIRNED